MEERGIVYQRDLTRSIGDLEGIFKSVDHGGIIGVDGDV